MKKIKVNVSTRAWELGDVFVDVCNAVERREDEIKTEAGLREIINEEIENYLIYTCNQWEVMKVYYTPQDADYTQAVNEFYEDVHEMISLDEEEEYECDEDGYDIDEIVDDEDEDFIQDLLRTLEAM